MATYYIDFEGGNDANAGTSFATRWKTITNGATAARIAPGDEIRIMASPDPTSIGNATWTGASRPSQKTITSTSNTSPIVITTSSAHGFSTGDYVSVSAATINTYANGTWKVGATTSTTFEILQLDGSNTTANGAGTNGNATKINNCLVRLGTPVTKNILPVGGLAQKGVWTPSTNVTATQNTTGAAFKEGWSAPQIAVGAAFTTGKAAYYTLPATLDLSTYQQASFWVQVATGALSTLNGAYIALCTDATGDVVAHQCPIPLVGATAVWLPVTVDFGANLNSAIQSIALYINTDNGAQTFNIDNLIACKASSAADSLTLGSLISKSDGTGDEAWYAVQFIANEVIEIGNQVTLTPNSTNIRGYSGASETVTTYKRETIKTNPVALNTSPVITTNEAGGMGNPISYLGGWNRTDMSTQTGWTWFDGQNGRGYGFLCNASVNYTNYDRFGLCRYYNGFYATLASFNVISAVYATSCSNVGVNLGFSSVCSAGNIWSNNNVTGVLINGIGPAVNAIKIASNCAGNGVSISGVYSGNLGDITASNCIGSALGNIGNCADVTVASLTSTDNLYAVSQEGNALSNLWIAGGSSSGSTGGASCANSAGVATIYFNNFTVNETTETSIASSTGSTAVYYNRLDDADGNNWQWQGAGTVNQQTAVVDSPATTSWRMSPTYIFASPILPLKLKLGTVVCAANSLVTVTARMRRTNTALTMRLICPGGQITGVASDAYTDMTAAANTWETVTITFTPTKAGGVDIYAYAFGGTTHNGYVCNLTASQA